MLQVFRAVRPLPRKYVNLLVLRRRLILSIHSVYGLKGSGTDNTAGLYGSVEITGIL